jgi:4-hydroxy-2-oxoheptanedioate aldolase
MMFPRTVVFASLCLLLTVWDAPGQAPDRLNPLIALLDSGKPAIGVWTGAIGASRVTRVLATSDVDFIVADLEHEVYDFPVLQRFLLQVQDFSQRYRVRPRTPPAVLVKLATRATWEPRYDISEVLKIGPAAGVWIPFVENRADLERAISAVRGAETSAMAGLNIPRDRRDVWPLNPKGELVVVAMIESEEGVQRAEEIISTPGVTAIQPVHLSEAGTAKVVRLCRERGVLLATDAGPADVKARLAEGYRLISVGWDFQALQKSLDETVGAMRPAMK